jgi:hypothetical protein
MATVQGDRDGHHHDRTAECRQDVAVARSSGESLPVLDSLHAGAILLQRGRDD